MTKKQLIEALKDFPDHAQVYIKTTSAICDGSGSADCDGDNFEESEYYERVDCIVEVNYNGNNQTILLENRGFGYFNIGGKRHTVSFKEGNEKNINN